MPIPTGGAWPPPAHQPAYDAYGDWDAWYVGDPGDLAQVYRGRATTSGRHRPSQYAGGVIGTLSRWLWGTPPRIGERDTRIHVPVPADLAATSAGLLYAEPPTLTCDTTAAQEAVEGLIEAGLYTVLRHAAEVGSVLGDVYLRPVIDQEVAPDRAIPTAVPADAAIPVIRWGALLEVTFWSTVLESSGTVLRLLEHHDVVSGAGRITYALHEGTDQELGRAIPLTEHPDVAHLAELLDETGSQPTGLDRLDVVRIPNAGPQRRWRKLGPLKYHGRSDLDGNEPIFDQVDETWTNWMRDIRNARGRITVPEYMLQDLGPGRGAVWDADREVYSAIRALPDQQSGGGLTVTQFAIRHVEHKATIDALMEAAMRHAGLSSQTMGEEGDVAVTATEVQARERRSFVSRGDRITTWAPELARYVELHLALERINFGGPAEERPNVEFGDSVTESPEQVARTAQLLSAAGAASTETLVRMVHPEWDDDQVREEVDRIKGDQPAPVEVGSALGALAGNEPADDEADEEPPPAEE
ncbi:Phage portal protein, SPP1 Gp6-like [Micromonospora sp. MW-13]|uniref:phage portal protein n=1 Tax=Micromonospora sp. MW-13 TaxID=2094022 RepID=UPI000E4451C3|nr:phage portal protein [Micromonospora sp. MW-13]RGC68431.1 Phage portal protein, SPP1 Gp6-like [Micromonospora sp. MW-13]